MMSSLQRTISTFVIFVIIFVIAISAKPWTSPDYLYQYDSKLDSFQPNPGYLSRIYLFNWIPENSEDSLPTKRNIAIGRGDGFRPGK